MRCRVCGCTDDAACVDEELEISCGWAEAGLCTFCADDPVVAREAYPNLARAGFEFP